MGELRYNEVITHSVYTDMKRELQTKLCGFRFSYCALQTRTARQKRIE